MGRAYVECGELDVWVLVPYPLLQRAHGIFRLHRLGANHVGYLEVEGHVFSSWSQHSTAQLAVHQVQYIQARGRGALDLFIERAVGRGPEPARHGVWEMDSMCGGVGCRSLQGIRGIDDAVVELLVVSSGRAGVVAAARSDAVVVLSQQPLSHGSQAHVPM
jgi:hypothetical protein